MPFIKRGVLALLSTVLLTQAVPAVCAQSGDFANENPSAGLYQDAEQGWFFYRNKPASPPSSEPTQQPAAAAPSATPPPTRARCKDKVTWAADCGFVDPGKDFDFQAKERDALLQAMVMEGNDPKAVENFQYYQKWAVGRAVEIADLWNYNRVQNPELDMTIKAPVSTFGLRLMTQVRDTSDASLFWALKDEGAFLIYFSRSDCAFCSAMSGVVQDLGVKAGLEVWNASLDDRCEPEFKDHCRTQAQTTTVAQVLQVTIVPTVFLYIPGPKSSQDAWIRIATGVADFDTMKGRVTSFFTAYRTALLKGVANGDGTRAAVDFSGGGPTGAADGVKASGDSRGAAPTEAEIKALLAQ